MKIALLTDSDAFAGTERHMLDLALELRALGVWPSLVCPAHGALAQRGQAAGVSMQGLEKRGSLDLHAIGQLRAWLAEGEFDLIHAHNGRTALLAALARHFTRRGALVATQHFLEPARAGRRGLTGLAARGLHRLADARIDRHIAISEAVAMAMLARHDTPPAKLRVVLNGIRDPRGQNLVSRALTRARLGVGEGAPLIVCLARLEAEKGVDTLVAAMREVTRALPAARCLVAGDGSMKEALRGQIVTLELADSVRLLGFMEDSLSLVEAADLFVLPSLAEPFGLSLVEAMALGKPVVATRAGGPVEIVREGQSGRLVPPRDPAALAAAIIAILSQPGAASALGGAGRQDYLTRFTARRMAAEILAVYEEAMPVRPRCGAKAGDILLDASLIRGSEITRDAN